MPLGEQLGFPIGAAEVDLSSEYDTTALLAAIRRTAHLPTATAPGCADADLLAVANAELRQYLAPRLLRAREEFFVAVSDVALVAGTAAYDVPSRAILGKLREVQLVASDGTVRNLPAGNPERLHGTDSTNNNGTPRFYYFRANSVVLSPAPDASDFPTLRLHYFRRPSRLISTASALLVDDVSADPTYSGDGALTTSNGELAVDIISGASPHAPTADDVTPFATGTGSVTFTASRTDIAAGDYVCLAGETPVLQMPQEFYDLLVLRSAMALVGPGVDAETRADLAERAKEAESNLFATLSGDRNEGEAEAVVNSVWA